MSRDASLDEFIGGGESDVDAEDDSAVADSTAASEGDAEIEPAEPTYVWSPDGRACARCESVVSRLWRFEGALVCEECKEW